MTPEDGGRLIKGLESPSIRIDRNSYGKFGLYDKGMLVVVLFPEMVEILKKLNVVVEGPDH